MFPFVHVPFISNTSISDLFSCCVNCQPLGKLRKQSATEQPKPSREIKTISSLVEKFTNGHDEKSRQAEMTPAYNIHPTGGGFYRPCSRQTSFNQDMNHEKFTPCEKKPAKNWHQNTFDSYEDNNYGKINFKFEENKKSNIIYAQKIPEKQKIVPPPRKKRPAPRPASNLDSKDSSQESILVRENWKNHRNLQLNNLDAPNSQFPNARSYESNNNNCFTCKINSSGLSSGSYVTNNKLIKNNKSGCSKVAVVSDNLGSNVLQTFRKFGSNRSDSINNNMINDSFAAGCCENKVYYKNSSFDKFGNYKYGNDKDEVLVCESYEKLHPKVEPKLSADRGSTAPVSRPKDSTYTKFYTDTFYQDHFELTSAKSIDEPFEQIVQLQPEMTPFFQSALAMLKAKRALLEKQQGQHPQTLEQSHQRRDNVLVRRSSTEEDDFIDEEDSIPVVFCGLLPIHQVNGEKWTQSVSEQTLATESPTENENHPKATPSTIVDERSHSIKQDYSSGSNSRSQDVRYEIVGRARGNRVSTVRTFSRDEVSTAFCGARVNVDECQYAGVDKCEL